MTNREAERLAAEFRKLVDVFPKVADSHARECYRIMASALADVVGEVVEDSSPSVTAARFRELAGL